MKPIAFSIEDDFENSSNLVEIMHDKQIKITYKPLRGLIIDKDMSKTELRKKTKIAASIIRYLSKDLFEIKMWI